MTNKFAVIIPTLMQNEVALTKLLDNLIPIVNDHEVVIVFQGSNVEAYNRFCNRYGIVRSYVFIKSDEVGISIARNIGIKSSNNEWVVLLDDDVVVKADFFELLEANVDQNQQFYYGNIYIEGTTKPYVNLAIRGHSLNFFSYNRVCSVALVINRKLLNTIGLFDIKLGAGTYFGSCEESDLILRALKSGVEIKYLPEHNVWHPPPFFPLHKMYRYGVGLGGLYCKHFRIAPLKLQVKFLFDISVRLLMLGTFVPRRYVFLYGFVVGFCKFK